MILLSLFSSIITLSKLIYRTENGVNSDEFKHGNITGIATQIFIGHAKFNIGESVSIVLKYQINE